MSVILHIAGHSATSQDFWNDILRCCSTFTPHIEPFRDFELFAALSYTAHTEQTLHRLFTSLPAYNIHMTATAAPNKFVARIGSLMLQQQPNAVPARYKHRIANTTLLCIEPQHIVPFLAPLPLRYLWSVPPKVHHRLRRLGIFYFDALQRVPDTMLVNEFGFHLGRRLARLARGQDEQTVHALPPQSTISVDTSYAADQVVLHYDIVANTLKQLAHTLAIRLQTSGYTCYRIRLHITTHRHQTIQCVQRLHQPTWHAPTLQEATLALFQRMTLPAAPAYIQLSAMHLEPPLTKQPELFTVSRQQKAERHKHVLTYVQSRFGKEALQFATVLKSNRRERMRELWQGG